MYNCIFCNSKSNDILKCSNCDYPLNDNICFFSLFALKKQFQIDKNALYASFLKLQQQFHPDKFLKKDASSRQDAERVSTLLNYAFNLLKDNRKRGEYLLKEANVYVNSSKDNLSPEQSLLATVFTKSEEISETKDKKNLELILNELEAEIAGFFEQFSKNFEHKLFFAAGQNLIAIRYYEKLIIEIQQKLEQY